jgi:probable F420-dependent oxidoreductase
MHPFRFAVQVTELPREGWAERVRWYEQLGFSAIHTPDHFTQRQWDPLTTHGAIAAMTSSAAVGASVLDTGFYHPMVLARAAATLAPIASGGYELGLGAGWMPNDYEMAGLPFERAGLRLERLRESVEIIRSLWTQEQTTYEGKHYRITNAPSVMELPLPVTPRVLIGGTMPKALGLAGAHADIVNMFPALPSGTIGWPGWAQGSTIERFVEKVEWIRAGVEQVGREIEDIELNTQITHTAVAEDPAPLQEFVAEAIDVPPAAQDEAMIFLTGTPQQVRERLERRREATGVSYHVIFDPTYNYAHPEGPPTLPGDDGPGAGDRYFESLADHVIEPLAGH